MADSASDKQRLKTAAESIWRNQQMSTQSVASALMDLIARYVDGECRQAAEIATLQKRVEELEKESAARLGIIGLLTPLIADITRQLEEERARLNWLQSEALLREDIGIECEQEADGIFVYRVGEQVLEEFGHATLREAIDEARNAAKEPA